LYFVKMLKGKRKSYPVNLKLNAIEYAKKTNNYAAARFFNVDHTQISRWRVKEEEFKNARKTSRRVGSGASSLYPLTENSLKEWIVKRRQRGIAVTPKNVKFCMTNLLSNEFKLSYSNALNTFKASDPWLNFFMNRFNLSLRRRTKTSQKLPKDLYEKVTEFYSFINELRINNNFELNCIANMDETPIYFDMVGAYTINDRGARTVPIRTTENNKNRFTYNSKNYLIELDQIEEEKDCIIDLVDENKENEENIATSSVSYINAERSYLIRENETEIM
ncbi:12277_t:CDS:2, partial [Dentiscutata erythropus]